MNSNDFSVVLVTVPSMDAAKEVAYGVVKKKLAACVNIVPGLTSIYEWKGKIEEDSELLLVIKTKHELFTDLKEEIVKNHPYEVPEVVELPIIDGHADYLNWILQVTYGGRE